MTFPLWNTVASAAGNVAGAIKVLTDLRHTPASPGVIRRAQMLLQNQLQQQQQQQQPNNAQVSSGVYLNYVKRVFIGKCGVGVDINGRL